MLCRPYYAYVFSNKIRDKGRTGSAWKRGKGGCGEQGGEMAQTMYAHVNKWKNNYQWNVFLQIYPKLNHMITSICFAKY
jgi:hypothetical protein